MTHLNDLGLTDRNATGGGCCGGGSCGCGHAVETSAVETSTAAASGTAAGAITTDLSVLGMTCSHCVASVTEELGSIDGVDSVSVQLNAGGVSTVTVTSASPLDAQAVRTAITEAGYSVQEV